MGPQVDWDSEVGREVCIRVRMAGTVSSGLFQEYFIVVIFGRTSRIKKGISITSMQAQVAPTMLQ
jgi:hypothetical protein